MYAESLTKREREILAAWTLPPPKRKSVLAHAGPEIDALMAAGYLKRLPTGGLYLADGNVLVLGAAMRDRLEQLLAVMRERGEVVPEWTPPPLPEGAKSRPAANGPRAPKPPKPPKAARVPPELDPRFHRNPESEAWARATYDAALAAHRAGQTTTLLGETVPVGIPAEPGIGDACAAWRRAILKGKPLVTQVTVKGKGVYKPLLFATRTQTDITVQVVELPGHDYGTVNRVIGRIFHPRPVVDCPSCKKPVPLAAWFEHGCEKPLVERDETFGDFHQLTDGAAEPVYVET